jgi:hypothetical protein
VSTMSGRGARGTKGLPAGSGERSRRARRATPVIALAATAFAIGAILGSGHHSSPQQSVAEQFAGAWAREDYATMYGDIDEASRRRISASAFAAAYQAAARTAAGREATETARSRCPCAWARGCGEPSRRACT